MRQINNPYTIKFTYQQPFIGVIYQTTNLVNGMLYRGQHRCGNTPQCNGDMPICSYLGSGLLIRAAIKKYGSHNFKKRILAFCFSAEELNEMEAYYVDMAWVERKDTYNLMTGGSHPIPSQETRNRISAAMKGVPKSPEHARKVALAQKGKPKSKEAVEKQRMRMIGRTPWNKDLRATQEHKEKMALARIGRTLTEEHKNNIGLASLGNKKTQECKDIISRKNTGKKRTLDVKARKSAQTKMWWLMNKIQNTPLLTDRRAPQEVVVICKGTMA